MKSPSCLTWSKGELKTVLHRMVHGIQILRFRFRRLLCTRIYSLFDNRIHFAVERRTSLPKLPIVTVRPFDGKRPPTVCFHIHSLGPGGAERQVAMLAKELAVRGYSVHILCLYLHGPHGHYLPMLRDSGVSVSTVRMRWFDFKFAMLCRKRRVHPEYLEILPYTERFMALSLARDLAAIQPDVFHAYLDFANTIGGVAAFMAGVPVVRFSGRSLSPAQYSVQNMNMTPGVMHDIYRTLLAAPCASMETNSQAGAADYADWLKMDREQIDAMFNAINVDTSQSSYDARSRLRDQFGISQNAPVVACIIRLTEEKNPLDCLKVARRVAAARPDVRFLHLGIGSMGEEFRALIQAYGLERHVILLGRRSDVPDILMASDALLLTSRVEGMSNAVMEAMASGLPVIATRVGGTPDLVADGEHGYLYSVGDDEGMAAGLLRLFSNPVEAKRQGCRGRQRMLDHFTIDALTSRTLENYQRCLERSIHDKTPNSIR